MSEGWKAPSPGAFESTTWPDKLLARAVDEQSGAVRLHGYDVVRDLAVHYRHSDVVYLAVTGRLPDEAQSWLVHVASVSLSTVGINEAPAHIGHLARLCGATIASIFGATALAAADAAQRFASEYRDLQPWIARGAPAPVPYAAAAESEATYVQSMVTTARRHATVPANVERLNRRASEVALLVCAGVETAEHLEALLAWALSSGAISEALLTIPGEFNRYPAVLPEFRYVAPEAEPSK